MISDTGKSYLEERPWGSFEQFTHNELTTVKLLNVKKGEAFSLQSHEHRKEYWRIMSGHPDVTLGDNIIHAQPGDDVIVETGMKHRISAPRDDVVALEIAFGKFDEADNTRYEDRYGRN